MDIEKSQVAMPVKCRLEEGGSSETRLVLLRRIQLAELHSKLSWLFNLKGYYQLRYLDKYGDLVTFSSEEEFQLALTNHQRPEFRVLITPIESHFALKLYGDFGKQKDDNKTVPDLDANQKNTASNFPDIKSAFDFSVPAKSTKNISAPVKTVSVIPSPVKSPADLISPLRNTTEFCPPTHSVSDSSNPNKKTKLGTVTPADKDSSDSTQYTNSKSIGKCDTDSSISRIDRVVSDLRPAIKTANGTPKTVVKFAESLGSGSLPDSSLEDEYHDWKSIFHPDYLKPRTSTLRRTTGRRRPPLDIQASLADCLATSVRCHSSLQPLGGDDFVHHGIECSRCGAEPLVGWRYKCSQCPNYNLCGLCFKSYSHGHGFYRLP